MVSAVPAGGRARQNAGDHPYYYQRSGTNPPHSRDYRRSLRLQRDRRCAPARTGYGVLEKRHIDSLSEEEEGWRRQLVNGTPDGRIPQGESMQELSERMHAALASCLELPAGSRPLLVSHGIALGCPVSTILGLPAYAERRLRLRNCSISRVDYQQSPWLASGWVVETAGDVSHLDAPAMDELQR